MSAAGWLRRHLNAALLVASAGVLLIGAWMVLRPYPVAGLRAGFPQSWRLYDRRGDLIREVVNERGARAHWLPLGEIPTVVVDATLAVEDARFWAHGGVDGRALLRASFHNATSLRVVSGASTLTMQLARLLRDERRRGVWSKLSEIVDAWRLERALTKPDILEQYLNRAPYGAGTIGIEAASQRYFGKPSQHLSLAEAALLAGLPQAPSELNPWRHGDAAVRRQRHVLARMQATQKISPAQHAIALAEPLAFVARPADAFALHFGDYVMAMDPARGDLHTTLDRDVQRATERLVHDHVQALSLGGLTNAAVVVLDNRDCEILAMVGSTNYWDPDGGSVNGATARRQPGSLLKPFLYALAFAGDFTPASVLSDIPTQYPGGDGRLMEPHNYDQKLSGPVLAADALGRSLNVPAIRLANSVGAADLLARLQAAGFTSLDQPAAHYGLGLTLGNGEVTLLEAAQGMAMLARGGLSCRARAVRDQATAPAQRVFSPEVAYLVTHILSDESLRVRAFGFANPLLFGYPIAVKTGTSSNWRDSWAVGYTPQHTLAVWSGDFSGRPMEQLSGAIGAGPLLRKVADVLTRRGAGLLPEPPPAGVEEVLVCPLSGMTPGEHCPQERSIMILAHHEPMARCTWHRPLRIDRRNGQLASPRCPSRFVEERVFAILPPRFAAWEAQHDTTRRPPTAFSPLCPFDGLAADAVVITHPRPHDVFILEPGYAQNTQSLALKAEVEPALPEVVWLLDGHPIATAAWPYDATWALSPGRHHIEAQAGNKRSEPVAIEVR